MLSITLDWLAFTFKDDTHEAAEWLSVYSSPHGAVETAPTNGYRTAYCSKQGLVSMWNVDRPEMGYHVILSGSALRNILEHFHMDQKTLVETIVNAGGSITRLDLAKDLQDKRVSLDKIYQALECGDSVGTARTFTQLHSVNGGNTVYIGSRQSEKFIRIYDKAAQLGDTSRLWYRFELETKGMVARALAQLLVNSAVWGSAFDTLASHMASIPNNAHWLAFFDGSNPEIGIPKIEKKSDREKWIASQVIPAVVKHYVTNRDSAAIALLRAMLDQLDNSAYTKE